LLFKIKILGARYSKAINMKDGFELKVRRQIERLQNCSFGVIEREVADKRTSWFNQNLGSNKRPKRPSPLSAYQLLFFDYMGVSKNELPVVSETNTEIVWQSRNRCPTLEACQVLQLDTRQVCRAIYEKSTQALVSRHDPQLRFLRSYEEIRPYAPHCRERIVRVNFEEMMKLALTEAKASKTKGNKGYGAVVAFGNQIIGKAHEEVI
jgi:hypothetical protein